MKARTRGILSAIAALALAGLVALSVLSEQAGCRNLIMVTLQGWSLSGQALQDAEDLCADEFLLTYEIPQNTTVKAANSAHGATLYGTNSAYPEVMGYALTDGGFFTKSAWDAKNRYAVLNECAAFAVFGGRQVSGNTVSIGGGIWTVVGVIQDNDADNINIYVPSSIAGGDVQSLMASMNRDKTGEMQVVNELTELGIRDTNAAFTNLSKAQVAFTERFLIAAGLALFAIAALLGKRGFVWLAQQISACKDRLQQVYFHEMITEYHAEIAKMCAVAVFLLADIGAMLSLSLRILETCLAWQELPPPERYLSGDFVNKLSWLYDYQGIGTGLFFLFAVAVAAMSVSAWMRVTQSKN